MTKEGNFTLQDIQKYFSVNELTGDLICNTNIFYRKYIGDILGNISKGGNQQTEYLVVMIDKREYKVHRLVYILYTGEMIESGLQIDHEDGNGLNNLRNNLRKVTNATNALNRSVYKTSKTGVSGVYERKLKDGTVKYRTEIAFTQDGIKNRIRLGQFDTIEEAKIVVDAKRKELGVYHENHGRQTL